MCLVVFALLEMTDGFLEHGVAGIVGEDVHVVGPGEELKLQGHQERVELRRVGVSLFHFGEIRSSGKK